jgi:hypothetical protein
MSIVCETVGCFGRFKSFRFRQSRICRCSSRVLNPEGSARHVCRPLLGFLAPCLAPAVGTIARSHRVRQGQRALDGVSPDPSPRGRRTDAWRRNNWGTAAHSGRPRPRFRSPRRWLAFLRSHSAPRLTGAVGAAAVGDGVPPQGGMVSRTARNCATWSTVLTKADPASAQISPRVAGVSVPTYRARRRTRHGTTTGECTMMST